MSKRFDVVALGELLIDFTEGGTSEQGNPMFEANPGGAPCNVLAMLRKLGKTCAFIGKVGNDMFGHQLRQVARDAGICMDALLMDDAVRTTLAFVKTDAHGDRDFSFYRNPGADMMLRKDELPLEIITGARIFHFGTLSMTHEDVREATKAAVLAAKGAGAIISFDPNLRPPLWDSLAEARAQIHWGLSQCDVLKIADNEIEFLTGTSDFTKGVDHKAVPGHSPRQRYRRRERQLCLLPGQKGVRPQLPAGRHHRDHRRGRYVLCQRAELHPRPRPGSVDPGRPETDASLCQRGGLPRHDEEGRDTLHAGARAGGSDIERTLNPLIPHSDGGRPLHIMAYRTLKKEEAHPPVRGAAVWRPAVMRFALRVRREIASAEAGRSEPKPCPTFQSEA